MSGCKHENTTVAVVWKDETMTRRCDSCKGLFGPYYVYDNKWRQPPKERK